MFLSQSPTVPEFGWMSPFIQLGGFGVLAGLFVYVILKLGPTLLTDFRMQLSAMRLAADLESDKQRQVFRDALQAMQTAHDADIARQEARHERDVKELWRRYDQALKQSGTSP